MGRYVVPKGWLFTPDELAEHIIFLLKPGLAKYRGALPPLFLEWFADLEQVASGPYRPSRDRVEWWSVEASAEVLVLSARRTRDLAHTLGGRKVAGKWQLSAARVRELAAELRASAADGSRSVDSSAA